MKLFFVCFGAIFLMTGCASFQNNWNNLKTPARGAVMATDLPPLAPAGAGVPATIGNQVAPPPRTY